MNFSATVRYLTLKGPSGTWFPKSCLTVCNICSRNMFWAFAMLWAQCVVAVVVQSLNHVQPFVIDPKDCSTPSFPVLHYLMEFGQTHVHWIGDAIQPSHPLSSPSPPAPNLSQHQGLFQRVSSWHQVAKVLELQQQSFQWIFRVDFLSDWLN